MNLRKLTGSKKNSVTQNLSKKDEARRRGMLSSFDLFAVLPSDGVLQLPVVYVLAIIATSKYVFILKICVQVSCNFCPYPIVFVLLP